MELWQWVPVCVWMWMTELGAVETGEKLGSGMAGVKEA